MRFFYRSKEATVGWSFLGGRGWRVCGLWYLATGSPLEGSGV